MRTLNHALTYSSPSDLFSVWFLTDWHLGAKGCNEKLLKQHIKRIAEDDCAYWIGGGDYIDAVSHVGDKRYKPETIAKWVFGHTNVVGKQRDYFLDMTAPIASKCLGMAAGNHEWESDRHYGGSVYWDMVKGVAERKGVHPTMLALGAQGFVRKTFQLTGVNRTKSWTMTTFIHHGFGGGRLAGGDALALQRMLNNYECDLLFAGHRHTYLSLSRHAPFAGGKTAKVRESWGVFMPGYLEPFIESAEDGMPVDTYPEEKGLPPKGTGAFPIEINPYERKIRLLVESRRIGS